MIGPLVTRRNGKMQACEPCRRRKVACDHGYPVCRRCSRRRNGGSTCFYAPPDQDARPSESIHSSQPVHEASMLDSQSTELSFRSNGHVALEDKFWSSPAARAPLGFFGPTSFSAAYLETETSLAVRSHPAIIEAVSPSQTTFSDEVTPASLAEIQDMANRDQAATHLAIKVLQAIPAGEQTVVAPFWHHINPNDEWMRMIGEKLVVSTWETFGSYLRDRADVAKLRELGGMICINTRRVLKEDQDDPQAWLESFSGPSLRWEAVGMIFIYAALSEFSASTSADSRSLIGHYTEYCSSCITLANIGGSSGSLMLFLLYMRSMLHAFMHGDTSLPYWKFHAETVAMLTFSGFHVDRPSSPLTVVSEPMVSVEVRRRIVCQIFIVDKFLATFVGRPPLLTRRFCSIKLPLDMDNNTLLSDKETFQNQVLGLDPDGWNRDCRLHSSSVLRVRTMVALVRDEILEIGLSYTGDYGMDDVIKLKNKEQELYQRLPPHLVCNSSSEDIRDAEPRIVYSKLVIRLDHLLNLFLVERLLLQHGRARSDLLRTSFEMVVLALDFWTHRHRWAEIQQECQWLIMGYAAPAGAVLCMELVDPNPVCITADGAIIAGETYSRSSIIQQLSLLVAFLNSSSQSQPNSSVASNVRSVIKRVLNHILDCTRQPQTSIGLESSDFATDWNNFAQFNPLDNFNWLSQDWSTEESTGT